MSKGEEFEQFKKDMRKASKGNSQYARLYAQLEGYLDNKEKEGEGLSASDYTRIARETKNRIREEYRKSGGVCPVCGECKVFRNPARMDTEPEHEAGGEMEALDIFT